MRRAIIKNNQNVSSVPIPYKKRKYTINSNVVAKSKVKVIYIVLFLEINICINCDYEITLKNILITNHTKKDLICNKCNNIYIITKI